VFLGDARSSTAAPSRRRRQARVQEGGHRRPARTRPIPPIAGCAESGYLTNETIFNLTERPRRLLVIGGGPLGCELAQAFSRLGCEVIIANREPYFLPGEERDAAEILADALRRDGIQVRLDTQVREIVARNGEKHATLVSYDWVDTVAVDEVLIGVGRVPNVDGLDLERPASSTTTSTACT
jgi:pyruvate/2-oxoglutarate dehydrogenase complex dihydrolipoamide dehydrogenase (E3) component